MDNKVKFETYSPEDVADYYNTIMPRVVKSVEIEDTFQGCRPTNTADLHSNMMRTAELGDNQMILDAGCGVGGPAIHIGRNTNSTIHSWSNSEFCIDYYKESLEKQKAEIKGTVIPTCRDYHLIGEHFAPKTFDRVMFLESFLYTNKPLELLKQVHSLLKDDGILYMKEVCLEDYSRLQGEELEKMKRGLQKFWTHFRYHYTFYAELKEILEEAGFEVVVLRKLRFDADVKIGDQYLLDLFGHDEFFETDERFASSDCFEFKCIKRKENTSPVAKHYDTYSDLYEQTGGSTIQSSRTANIDDLHNHVIQQAGLKPGQVVLDAGCGIGGPALYFAKNAGVKVEGITISQVEKNKVDALIAKEWMEEKMNVVRDDFANADKYWSQGYFDTVLFLESLGHADAPAEVLKKMFGLLKPGGTVFIKDYFINESNLLDAEKRDAVLANVKNNYALNVLSLPKLISDLSKAGFVLDNVTNPQDGRSWDAFFNFEKAAGFDTWNGMEKLNYLEALELKFHKPQA